MAGSSSPYLPSCISVPLSLPEAFWDCGEFIASSFKLQVGHPPGAPLFMMMGRVMSLFAGSDLTQVSGNDKYPKRLNECGHYSLFVLDDYHINKENSSSKSRI
ncbi:MAG: DUF2723 domain-containing protein [Bacteroidetes bacterium]|nr:DUF2723 domain-containing protein [Bacteroidota bacterium]